jgi:hypothetical protein
MASPTSAGGIVSIGDVVKNYVSEIDSERQALKDYVSTAG